MWDKTARAILKSLRCPICGGQIDIFDWKHGKKNLDHNFCCVHDWEHYRLHFTHWEMPIRIDYETVVLYEGSFQYEVKQENFGGNALQPHGVNGNTTITIRKTDPEKRILDNQQPKTFWYTKKLFDFTQTNKDKIYSRIRTILTFQ